jgi:hypothetical protein
MLKAAIVAHAVVQSILPGVAKRRVPEIMRQRHRLDKILVEVQRSGNAAPYLGDLKTVCQTRTEKITLMIDEDLRLVFETTKRGGMNDTVAVALKLAAQRRPVFGKTPAARIGGKYGVRREFRHAKYAP